MLAQRDPEHVRFWSHPDSTLLISRSDLRDRVTHVSLDKFRQIDVPDLEGYRESEQFYASLVNLLAVSGCEICILRCLP